MQTILFVFAVSFCFIHVCCGKYQGLGRYSANRRGVPFRDLSQSDERVPFRALSQSDETHKKAPSAAVGDRVIARRTNNLYYPGIVKAIEEEQVIVLLVGGDRINHKISDSSAVIPDEEPAGEVQIGQHVLATWKGSHAYYIGFVTVGEDFDGRFKVTFDNSNDKDYYTASQLRLFPEQDSQYKVGARVFARWTDCLYYRGFVTESTDESVVIHSDNDDRFTLKRDDVNPAVILDEIPPCKDVSVGQRVIGYWPKAIQYFPGVVISKRICNEENVFDVEFKDGAQRAQDFNEIRVIPSQKSI